MKNKLLQRLALLICLAGATSTFGQEIFTGNKARALFPNTEMVRTSKYSSAPSYIKFLKGQELDRDNFKAWVMKNFRMEPGMNLVLERTETDNLGHIHYRYRQTFNGHPIDFAEWIVHTNKDKVYSMNGLLYPSLSTISTAGMAESTALTHALNFVGANTYKWELEGEEAHLKKEQNDPTATYYPHAEVVYVSENASMNPNSFKLAYKFNIYAHEPVSRAEIYVDANTGEILFENEVFHHIDVIGTAQTAYSGAQTITADSFGGSYRLREASRGNGVNTYDMNEGTNYGNAVDFTDNDNNWDNANANLDEYATDAHWGAEMTYDYFWLQHGRNSIDGNGFALNSYVHYDVLYANAFWDGQRMTYGDGNGGSWNPLTALDIAGHEVTHGLTTFTAGLIYNAESGALNESFSDIFGTSIENFALPSNWDWLIGEDIGSPLRSMSNPNAYGDPDTYFGNNWASLTGGDNGGVHTNSGVQNFWYYLLVTGGTGTNDNADNYTVNGIGFTEASQIAFRNLTVYLTASSDFADARFYSIQSAVDIFGGCTPQVEACTNAWYAVGVGPEYVSTVTADMMAPVTVSCQAPFTADFSNLSNNGSTFEWDFGDGSTGTGTNPSHTYTNFGLYTITLIADGGLCGIDTAVFTDYIDVDNGNPCIVTMPTNGSAPVQTSCSGTIYDSGGLTNDYGANEDGSVTISPIGAATVDLTINFFDIEPGQSGSCNYDYLEVYDGPSTASPLIDTYCNNNVPPAVISSTGPDITVVFHSDPGLELEGYEIDWDCVLSNVPPTADFNSSVDTTCSGEVNFTDLSSNGPTQWDWDFGDGAFSTLQNPSHTYSASGAYTVKLVAQNTNGSDSMTYVDIIYVDLPVAPTVNGESICENTTANLTASGTGGNLEWYTQAVGGSSVNTGSSYTTPILNSTTSYWVEEHTAGASQNLGPFDNSIGSGAFFNGNQHLVFDVASPVTLKTVKVFANGDGNRTIELRNSSGTVVETTTIFIPDGEQVITLDFPLTVGTDWQLGTQTNSNQDLFRNDGGTSYPYIVGGGEVTITQASPGTGWYYFFYNWEIESPGCISERAEVIADVSAYADASISAVSPLCPTDSPVTLNAAETGGTWSGTGVSSNTFDPSVAGSGTHTVTYTISGLCGDTDTEDITVIAEDDPSFTYAQGAFCLTDANPLPTISGLSGGTFSIDGSGVIQASTGEIDISGSGPGSYIVTYLTNGTCPSSTTFGVTLTNGADATISSTSLLCDTDSPINLSAVDGGGSWTGSGITNSSTGEFDPSVAGAGTHTISYTITGSCGDTDTEDVIVEATPDASITAAGPFCRYEESIQLTAASSGGVWSADCGSCIDANTGEFNPAVAGPGTWTITYTISGNCPSTETTTITVDECLSIGELDNLISIYPNPSNGLFIIAFENTFASTIVIRDVSGRLVFTNNYTDNKVELDLKNLAEGTYFLTVLNSDKSMEVTKKIQILR